MIPLAFHPVLDAAASTARSAASAASSAFGSVTATNADAPFANLFQNAIQNVQSLEDQASSTVGGLLRGDGVDIHSAMIATQKADLSFELALAVRGKAVAAYQTMMSMQF